jgi:PAS domain S-box-containing protein
MGLTSSPNVDILIVDDRLDGLIALEAVLGAPGLNLVRSQSGKEALSLLSSHDFGVILLDVQMPEMDGFETARRIRTHAHYKDTPIVFVTAINKDDRHIYRGYEVGAVDYIFKPFEPQILRSKVKIFVDLFLKTRLLQEQAELIRDTERQARFLQLAQLEMETLKRYRSLADAVPNMIWKSKVDGTLDYFNKVWTEYTGLTQEQSVGSGWQDAIHPEDLRYFLKAWIESMNYGSPFQTESRVRRHDGAMRWHWIRAIPEINSTDTVTAWIGTCTDIHDRKLSEQKLIDAERQAVAANEAKTHFLANMSHEIRTPLSAILGFAELMLNTDLNQEERVSSINTICRSGQQLLKIIDEILDISKVEAGHLQVERIDVNVSNLLKDLRSLLSVRAQAKEISLDIHLKSDVPEHIFSDPTRLRQILTNMISNAIKFTERGKVMVEVNWVEGSAGSPPKLQFHVSDTGVGIQMAHAEKLFQPFVQMDSSTTRKFGGTGLGLALSRKLAQALGGNVCLEQSQEGQGSTFLVEVQADLVEQTKFISQLEDSAVVEPLRSTAGAEKLELDGIRILLVEDAAINQILITKFLTAAGAKVDLAENGRLGVQKALAGNYGIVLMDIQMPEMDGYQATSTLRASGFKTPIIALTAHALKEDRDRCLGVGCSDHLTKPIDRKKLISQISYFVGLHEATN